MALRTFAWSTESLEVPFIDGGSLFWMVLHYLSSLAKNRREEKKFLELANKL